MHNIAKQYNVPNNEIYREEDNDENIEAEINFPMNMHARGQRRRETIIETYFT